MRHYLIIFAIALLGLAPASAHASGATMFPPEAATCDMSGAKYNIITWDGENNVHCLQMPKCASLQILVWDGTTMSCYPTGTGGTPTAAIPPGLGITYVGPAAPLGPTPPLPPGVTPVTISPPPGGP